jgi:hypothetical protein
MLLGRRTFAVLGFLQVQMMTEQKVEMKSKLDNPRPAEDAISRVASSVPISAPHDADWELSIPCDTSYFVPYENKTRLPPRSESSNEIAIPDDESETIRQFLLDAPRMDVTIDGRTWTENQNPKKLLDYMFRVFPRWSASLAAEFCTQTALAPYFCSVRETLQPDTHFVDGGRQTIRLDSKALTLKVEKPFKVVDFDESMNSRVLFVVTLVVEVDLQSGKIEHHFNRSSVVEKDWVYVEELCQEDKEAFENGAGAQDIAASALRMRHS